MPTLYYRVEAPGVNILKTVTDEAIAGLLLELQLVDAFKDAVYPMSSFMASSQYSDSNGAPTLNKNRCDVEVEYVMDKSQVPWPVDTPYTTTAYGVRSSNKGTHTPILIDPQAGIFIEHYTVACALDMKFVMTFTTFDMACRAFDTIQSRYKGSLIQTPFDLSFSYPVNVPLLEYLTSVFSAKTDYKGKTLTDYINDMKKTQISFDVRKSQLTSITADKELMIRCQQLNCLAQLTMDQKEPDVIREHELPLGYTLSFSMVLQFGRPTVIAVNTPISVDNTVLPYGLFANIEAQFHYSPYVSGVYQDLLCNQFMKRSYGDFANAHNIIRLPVYDDWFSVDAQYGFYQYRPFLIQHFTLDGAVTTINIRQFDDVVLHPIVQSILTQMGNEVFNYGGLFTIGVYAGNLRLGPELLNVDADLNLTITSSRPDQQYHLVLSESTNLSKMNASWDDLLIRYRYFFPLTIERNLDTLIKKKYFYIGYDNIFLSFISALEKTGKLKSVLQTMITLGEDTNQIYSYTQNPSQLADYMTYTQSKRGPYVITNNTDPVNQLLVSYYTTQGSSVGGTVVLTDADGTYLTDTDGSLITYEGDLTVLNRSLFVAFIEQCLIAGYITLDKIPRQYIEPSQTVYPYYSGQGGYYGFNTPLRVFQYTVGSK